VMTTLMLSAILTLVGILVSDILYVIVNPRVSFDGK
jgi:peptide/nickel transport system permease protein